MCHPVDRGRAPAEHHQPHELARFLRCRRCRTSRASIGPECHPITQRVHSGCQGHPLRVGGEHLVPCSRPAEDVAQHLRIGVQLDLQLDVPARQRDQQQSISAQDRLRHASTITESGGRSGHRPSSSRAGRAARTAARAGCGVLGVHGECCEIAALLQGHRLEDGAHVGQGPCRHRQARDPEPDQHRREPGSAAASPQTPTGLASASPAAPHQADEPEQRGLPRVVERGELAGHAVGGEGCTARGRWCRC